MDQPQATDAALMALLVEIIATYKMPPHLSSPSSKPGEQIATALKLYGPSLRVFPASALQGALERVKETHKNWTWPPVGIVVDACRKGTTNLSSPARSQKKWPWEQKADNAKKMVLAYLEHCKTTALWHEASCEKWLYPSNGMDGLAKYLSHRADTQACAIVGITIGYQSWVYGYQSWCQETDSNDTIKKAVSLDCTNARARGFIDAMPPHEAITWMKTKAQQPPWSPKTASTAFSTATAGLKPPTK